MDTRSAIVIGAGIVGLATARALAQKGFHVTVLEKQEQSTGASVRNFGMIWPIGQPTGALYQRALRSRTIWKELADAAGIWYEEAGSLHLAYHADEAKVLEELAELFNAEKRPVTLLNKESIIQQYEAVNPQNLLAGLHSSSELIVDPREAIATLPAYLSEKYPIRFLWGKCVSYIADQTVYIGETEEYEADLVFVCNGADFETLYPEEFNKLPITKCKLQMMRLQPQPANWRMGTSLCGGLSLIHYQSFKIAPSLPLLKKRYEEEMDFYLDWGIHVMASQNGLGEITVGDSHEYGRSFDPFDKSIINKRVMDYLQQFTRFKTYEVLQSWHGIYAKMTNGETEIFLSPETGVYILNGLGGAGMTLSFGLAEECVEAITG